MSKPRIAVVGVGRLGSIHAKLIREAGLFDLVALVDPVPASRLIASEQFGTPAVADVEEILHLFDCAIIATPTVYHHQVAIQLLESGKHLLIEKPITATVAQADELVAAAKSSQVVLQVGHVERFNPAFEAVCNDLGTPVFIDAVRASEYTFRSTDVGVTLDLMIHDLDLILSLVPHPVISIQATGLSLIGPHEDVAYARLTFANGCLANLTASRSSYEQQRHMRITGDRGFANIDFANRSVTTVGLSQELKRLDIDPDSVTQQEREDLQARYFTDLLPKTELSVPDSNPIAMEQADFLQGIATGDPVRVSGKAGRDALSVAIQITEQINRQQSGDLHAVKGPHFASKSTHVSS